MKNRLSFCTLTYIHVVLNLDMLDKGDGRGRGRLRRGGQPPQLHITSSTNRTSLSPTSLSSFSYLVHQLLPQGYSNLDPQQINMIPTLGYVLSPPTPLPTMTPIESRSTPTVTSTPFPSQLAANSGTTISCILQVAVIGVFHYMVPTPEV